jgi:hypothetical protein
MEAKKDKQKEFSTCLEGSPFAETMQKMMGQQGTGSLCDAMMRSMMKKCCGIKEAKEEESHV